MVPCISAVSSVVSGGLVPIFGAKASTVYIRVWTDNEYLAFPGELYCVFWDYLRENCHFMMASHYTFIQIYIMIVSVKISSRARELFMNLGVYTKPIIYIIHVLIWDKPSSQFVLVWKNFYLPIFLTFLQLPSKAHFAVLDCNECSSRRGLDTGCLIWALTSETSSCPTVGASLCDCYAKTPPSLNWVSSRSTWPCVFTPFVELDHHLDQFPLIAHS